MNKKVAELQKNKLHSGLISVPDIQLLEEVNHRRAGVVQQLPHRDEQS